MKPSPQFFPLFLFSLLLFLFNPVAPLASLASLSAMTDDQLEVEQLSSGSGPIKTDQVDPSLTKGSGVPFKAPTSSKGVGGVKVGEVVNCSYLNFRSAPWGKIHNSYPKGTRVKVTGKEGDWYKVDLDGKKGYMHSKYIKIVGGAEPGLGEGPGSEDPGSEINRIQKKMDGYVKSGDRDGLIQAVLYALTYVKGLKDDKMKLELLKIIQIYAQSLSRMPENPTPTQPDQPEAPPVNRPPRPKPSTRAQRLAYYAPDIIAGACALGFPPSIVAAQFVLESDAGRAMPANSNNAFGVKCGSAPKCVKARTSEVYDGRSVSITAGFRVYNSVADSIKSHAAMLLGKERGLAKSITSRVNAALASRSHSGIIRAIKAGGYATAPNYVASLEGIIKSNNFKNTLDSKCPAVRDIR